MCRAAAEIRSALRAAAVPRSEPLQETAAEDAAPALAKLLKLIEGNDSEALEAFEALRATLEKIAGRDETDRLAALLSGYDFAGALALARSLPQGTGAFRREGRIDVGHG